MIVLLLAMGSAGYFLVTQPALERHAQSMAATLLPTPLSDCTALKAHFAQLALDGGRTGVHIVGADRQSTKAGASWLLPVDAMLVARLRERADLQIDARSTIDTLHLKLNCADGSLALALDRRIALGVAPGLALLAWLVGLTCAALGLAAWLSRALNAPLQRIVSHLRGTPFGAVPTTTAATGIREFDRLVLEVDALRERASEAVASRTALLMGLSHDLRTPLARVRLILDTAQPMTALDTLEMKSHLIEMQESMDEFMRAANAMAATPVAAGAKMVWTRLQSVFTDPRLAFINPPTDTESPLNSAALLRIASNFIDNALRHGEGRVEVSWEQSDDGWCLCVADEGPGIAPENMPRALRAFGRDPARKDDTCQHAGVGLALARILCEHNGWALHVTARKPQGLLARVEYTTPQEG